MYYCKCYASFITRTADLSTNKHCNILTMVKFLTLIKIYLNTCIFTRDSIYAIARICYRQSVRPSVCLSYGCIIEKRLKLGMKFSPYGSHIPIVFQEQISSRNSEGFPTAGALNEDGVGKIGDFRTLNRHNRNVYTRFPLVPKSMTLSDP